MALGTWPVYLRGLLVLAGGWQMAIGIVYQVKLFAQQKNGLYYTLLVFAGIFGLSMLALTLFWLDSLQ
ncbi:hypothetical protein GO730_07540 [Spirosoma sp. HMF3257]|nr:hypothetical protein [Spirosoma telluris]